MQQVFCARRAKSLLHWCEVGLHRAKEALGGAKDSWETFAPWVQETFSTLSHFSCPANPQVRGFPRLEPSKIGPIVHPVLFLFPGKFPGPWLPKNRALTNRAYRMSAVRMICERVGIFAGVFKAQVHMFSRTSDLISETLYLRLFQGIL